MIVSCNSRIRVPSVKVRVKVGCISTGITSFATGTGLGAGVSSFTATSFELRAIAKFFINASSEVDSTNIAVLLSAFLVP